MTVQSVDDDNPDTFKSTDIVLSAVNSTIARKLIPQAVLAGAIVIDNSSAFRMAPDIPLVIPEVNPETIPRQGIIANPNCSTIIMLMAVTPIRRLFGVKRIAVSTYQAASGAGVAAMCELRDQTRAILNEKEPVCRVFNEVCAFNIFSHNSSIGEDGYNIEEQKMIEETRKIWNDHSINITATCIRVPVFRAHGETINLTLNNPITEDDLTTVKDALQASPGLRVIDDKKNNKFPTAKSASGQNDILIGRIRLDRSQMLPDGKSSQGLEMFVVGDQIRKGAALNAVQIAEHLISE